MKRKIIILSLLALCLCLICGRAARQGEYWLRTEENGIVHDLSYIHELAANNPRKAQTYVGKPISFSAPLLLTEENVTLEYYGRIQKLLRLSAFDGREFIVQGDAEDSVNYVKGSRMRVSGRITELNPRHVMLLNIPGTPGWPNEINIETLK